MFKFLIRLTITFAVMLFFILELNSQSITPSTRMKNGFYIGANGGFLYSEYFGMYKKLGYRTNAEWGFSGDWQTNIYDVNRIWGGFFDSLTFYLPSVTQMLTRWIDSIQSPNSIFYRSSKIDRPCYGQRSTYQVEDNATMVSQKPGYGYKYSDYNLSRNNITDSSNKVKYCEVNTDTGKGYVAYCLYENNEQTNVITRRNYDNAYYSDRKRIGDNFRWYIKPRMRIDSAFANNPNNWNKKVVRIEIYNYSGRMLGPTIDIKVENFLDTNFSNYNGNYIELFNYRYNPQPYPLSVLGDSLATDIIDTSAYYTPREFSNVDYRVYWYGEVNVWLDYVRLDDEWAHFLFTENETSEQNNPANRYKFHKRIREEVQNLSNQNGFGYFYFDEFYYNSIPCIKEVLRLIKQYNPNTGITVLSPPAGYSGTGQGAGIKNELTLSAMYDTLKQAGLLTDFVATDVYTIFDDSPIPPNLNKPDIQEFPGTLMYKKALSVDQYDDNLNTNILSDGMRNIYKLNADVIKKSNFNAVFVATIQAHSVESNFQYVECNDTPKYERKREPTNEEIGLQAYYAMAYGAKQIHYFTFFSGRVKRPDNSCPDYFYDWGLTYFDTIGGQNQRPRDTNYYGQRKWDYVAKLDSNLMKIGSFMYQQNDLKYDNTIAIEESETHNYISGLKSYYRDQQTLEFLPVNEDPANKTYWEIGFFDKQTEPISKYFLVLNKRCVPEIPEGFGDIREAKLILNSNHLQNFNNWKIINPVTNESVTFNKNNMGSGIYLPGTFQPGEGKLFKLAPVMTEGGTFVCDEEVVPSTFVCDSTVFNNEHDLRLYQGTTIKFNPKGKIVFTGGSFYSGIQPQNSSPLSTEFIGNSCVWEGISFTGGTDIHISNSVFKNIAYEPPGGLNAQYQNCALSIINCNDITISSSQFYMDFKSGAIYYQYNSYENPRWENAYIGGNTFTISQSNTNSPLVTSFSSLSAIETPIRLEGNYFNNISGTPAIATAVNGVCGGTIKNNNFYKFSDGVIAANSSIDLYNNRFYSNIASSKSVQGFSESNLNMSPNDEYCLGGYNRIYTMNDESKNVYVDNSFVFLENGDNTFNISEYSGIGEKPYHIFGTFPSINEQQYPAAYNCFKIDSIDAEAFVEVTVNGTPIEFNFYSYSCNALLSGDYEVVSIEGLVNDTIAVKHTGQGGSEKGNGGNGNELQVSRCKMLTDSININIRKRQHSVTEQKCIELLNLFPDSSSSIDALNKLYLSSLLQDSAGSKMAPLKAFYETVILSNPGKEKLINRCFYLIQKCKVSLKQYTSALEGFSLIIQQNPYTYEGLVASWDFAATHLLDSLGGSSGGLTDKTDDKQFTAFDVTDRYDSTKFTKKQRSEISKSVNDILESKRITQTEKIETLQKKSDEGNREAAKELHTMKRLSETVKTKKPGNNSELQGIIQSDIKKVFSRVDNNTTESVSIIPQTYQLYQNYPNPFNPTTKIAFDLPKDAKVKLLIYDILGREMKTLVNNEFRSAGKYITEFNGSNMASGIYFARILVNDGKDLIAVKKMILIK